LAQDRLVEVPFMVRQSFGRLRTGLTTNDSDIAVRLESFGKLRTGLSKGASFF
jgi:hypothetical protein